MLPTWLRCPDALVVRKWISELTRSYWFLGISTCMFTKPVTRWHYDNRNLQRMSTPLLHSVSSTNGHLQVSSNQVIFPCEQYDKLLLCQTLDIHVLKWSLTVWPHEVTTRTLITQSDHSNILITDILTTRSEDTKILTTWSDHFNILNTQSEKTAICLCEL